MSEVLKKYKISGEIFPTDEHGTPNEEALEIGSIQEVPEELGNSWVEQGLASTIEDDTVAEETTEDDAEETEA